MKSIFFLLALTLFTISGCEQESSELAPNVAQLAGTWQLRQPASEYPVTLQFDLDTNNPPNDVTPFKARGRSSVNYYTGLLSAALDGMMIVTDLGSTKMAGSPEAMQFEQTYFANLKSVVRFEITSTNRLRLYYGTPQPGTLEFEKIK